MRPSRRLTAGLLWLVAVALVTTWAVRAAGELDRRFAETRYVVRNGGARVCPLADFGGGTYWPWCSTGTAAPAEDS